MAKNDAVLLDGIIDERATEHLPSAKEDEVFEYFTFEQLLKPYDLSREDIESGWIDGRDDGGFDGFFTIVNGRLVVDPVNFAWPRSDVSIDVWLISAKHHPTFLQAPLDNVYATIAEFSTLD